MKRLKPVLILCLLAVFLFAYLYAASTQCEWTKIEKIVAVGDVHGDYDSFVKILRGTGLIDNLGHWTGGKTHLVQIGDVMDKGDNARGILDLIMRLETEAEKAGGKVHMLLGNHEELNITGYAFDNPGYVTLKQFKSFLPDRYIRKQEKIFRKKMSKSHPREAHSDSSIDNNLDKYWEDFHREVTRKDKHPARRQYTISFNTIYGRWLIKQNAVIKINDTIFVHGGIHQRFSTKKLKEINNRLRLELKDYRWAAITSGKPNIDERNRLIVYVSEGPLWFRGLAQYRGKDWETVVDTILLNLKAQNIVIGHTPQINKKDMKRFGGKIWIIDTAISETFRSSGGFLSALIIENGKFSRKYDF
ncbi:MAG: metallophosphoesterase [Candidatus Aminicenantes bacterium]|nr:metallophosphoesterase [Candidatus Aminicenantes bacterium]